MRKQTKDANSLILHENLSYTTANVRPRIAAILYAEQKGFCAYTEEYISRTDAEAVEHFNPTLKNEPEDSYHNWFLCKSQWNMEKGSSARWKIHQPCLHPTAADFESRIIYHDNIYRNANETDIDAQNTIAYLNLNDEHLVTKREYAINRHKANAELMGQPMPEYLSSLPPRSVDYPTAIKSVFRVDVWDTLPTPPPLLKKYRL
jgi:uncharacterized protein (TIGR02646 family)